MAAGIFNSSPIEKKICNFAVSVICHNLAKNGKIWRKFQKSWGVWSTLVYIYIYIYYSSSRSNRTFTLSSVTSNSVDPALQKLGDEAKRIKNSNMVIVNADKTGNKYEMSAADYKQRLHDNITRDYKLDSDNKLASINRGTKSHAKTLEIDDRMECHSEANAFLTIKDHKEEFPNKIKCRVINPASNNLGKVSKRILDKINTKCRRATRMNQWRSTQNVVQWFSGVHAANPTKNKAKFLQFDINEFYPSISEELLRNSIRFAKNHATIEQGEEDLIMACRKSILFNDGRAWTKKEKNFDVTMGA